MRTFDINPPKINGPTVFSTRKNRIVDGGVRHVSRQNSALVLQLSITFILRHLRVWAKLNWR